MNKKLFLKITVLAILIMFAALIFRAAIDEVEMGPLLRFFDSIAIFILSILGFGFRISLFLFGKEPQYPFLILAISLVVSGIIWGFIIERLIFLIRKGSVEVNNPAEPGA